MMGPRMRLTRARQVCAISVVAAAAGAAGCSGNSSSNSSSEHEATCASRQINPLHGRDGRCISGRNLYVVAARGKPVRLADATVSLANVALVRKLPRGRGRVIIELRIANRGSRPLAWRHRVVERAALISEGRRFLGRVATSPRSARSIPPRAAGRRGIAFDLPLAVAVDLVGSESALFFAADIQGRDTDTTIGVIRLPK
jgi:hypothetical protein